MALKPSFDGLTSTPKSTGLRMTPVQTPRTTTVTTQNTPKPTPSQRGHA